MKGDDGDSGADEKEEKIVRHPLREKIHRRHHVVPPAHHVVAKQATLLNYVPSVIASAPEVLYNTTRTTLFLGSNHASKESEVDQPPNSTESLRTGFKNPWPSWHKPEVGEYWHGMHWRKSANTVQHGMHWSKPLQALHHSGGGMKRGSQDSFLSRHGTSRGSTEEVQLGDAELQIVEPDFGGVQKGIAQATWLGHATVLVQLPPLDPKSNGRPLRILFDPIFSMRCSPFQTVGPIRSYPPPCTISSLPEIDLVIISHSHYDHLDRDSIVQLWYAHHEYIRFLVPLGVREWFLSLGIGIREDCVTELDWWDEAWLDHKFGEASALDRENMLRVICTPAQHGSGRYAIDASQSLWSSWTIEHICKGSVYRIFFGGDTGFQFHSSVPEASTYPTCPAFAEVAKYIGMPHLSFLPISVGASMNFVKSYDIVGLVPDLDEGLTAANHMTPQDAVRVAKIMRGAEERDSKEISGIVGKGKAVAIHWGTFVTGPDEVRKSMQELRMACRDLGVSYVRDLDEREIDKKVSPQEQDDCLSFACLNHGQSVYLAMGSD